MKLSALTLLATVTTILATPLNDRPSLSLRADDLKPYEPMDPFCKPEGKCMAMSKEDMKCKEVCAATGEVEGELPSRRYGVEECGPSGSHQCCCSANM